MPVQWFVCTYKRIPGHQPSGRYCAMDDYSDQIYGGGGAWSEVEVLGNYAVVKVRASQATLDMLASIPGFERIPLGRLDAQLSALPSVQRQRLRSWLSAQGYSDAEVSAGLGSSLASRTLGELLRFAASRRRDPRYDVIQDLFFLDGPVRACESVDGVDRAILEG